MMDSNTQRQRRAVCQYCKRIGGKSRSLSSSILFLLKNNSISFLLSIELFDTVFSLSIEFGCKLRCNRQTKAFSDFDNGSISSYPFRMTEGRTARVFIF
jgi:hypothetical protein